MQYEYIEIDGYMVLVNTDWIDDELEHDEIDIDE